MPRSWHHKLFWMCWRCGVALLPRSTLHSFAKKHRRFAFALAPSCHARACEKVFRDLGEDRPKSNMNVPSNSVEASPNQLSMVKNLEHLGTFGGVILCSSSHYSECHCSINFAQFPKALSNQKSKLDSGTSFAPFFVLSLLNVRLLAL